MQPFCGLLEGRTTKKFLMCGEPRVCGTFGEANNHFGTTQQSQELQHHIEAAGDWNSICSFNTQSTFNLVHKTSLRKEIALKRLSQKLNKSFIVSFKDMLTAIINGAPTYSTMMPTNITHCVSSALLTTQSTLTNIHLVS